MQTSQIVLVGGHIALDFCNTMEYRGTDHETDLLRNGFGSLVRWCRFVNLLDDAQAEQLQTFGSEHPEQAAEIFHLAQARREATWQLFVSAATETAASPLALDTFNGWLREIQQERRIIADATGKFTWGWEAIEKPDAFLRPIGLLASELLTSGELSSLKQCPGCGWLFLDKSRNHSRTWCDMRFCGNRSKARRHYQHKKDQSASV